MQQELLGVLGGSGKPRNLESSEALVPVQMARYRSRSPHRAGAGSLTPAVPGLLAHVELQGHSPISPRRYPKGPRLGHLHVMPTAEVGKAGAILAWNFDFWMFLGLLHSGASLAIVAKRKGCIAKVGCTAAWAESVACFHWSVTDGAV